MLDKDPKKLTDSNELKKVFDSLEIVTRFFINNLKMKNILIVFMFM